MPTTSVEFAWAKAWIGENEAKTVFDERFDRLTPTYSDRDRCLKISTEESLRSQLAKMVNDAPSSVSVDGVSVSYVTNITTLRENLASFSARYGTAMAKTTEFFRQRSR